MKQQLISDIESKMQRVLDNYQLEELHRVLLSCVQGYDISLSELSSDGDVDYVSMFLAAKKIEGRSDKSLKYYQSTIEMAVCKINKSVKHITTDDLRTYLASYQKDNNSSKVTIDNIRRILSSFFGWLEDEDYTDEQLETLRDGCITLRDLAIIDLLASTGMRVGEMVLLNINDINFEERECIVFGKGDKERIVYFDARTKLHLQNYLESRTDSNSALFVSLKSPYNRLEISGIEVRLRELGLRLNIPKVHPHKFRRTLATMAIDKGMPIEQLQKLLGHSRIDTTLQYAMVKQSNVKLAHRKFIG